MSTRTRLARLEAELQQLKSITDRFGPKEHRAWMELFALSLIQAELVPDPGVHSFAELRKNHPNAIRAMQQQVGDPVWQAQHLHQLTALLIPALRAVAYRSLR